MREAALKRKSTGRFCSHTRLVFRAFLCISFFFLSIVWITLFGLKLEDDESRFENSISFFIQQNVISPNTVQSPRKPIRKWGCRRTETPLIFVHIGKAGGGEIRARLAGAAMNYNRKRWELEKVDSHFYPIRSDPSNPNLIRAGRFCNSKYAHPTKIPPNEKTKALTVGIKAFEGNRFCNATTPFGMSIACVLNYRNVFSMQPENPYDSSLCLRCDDDYYLEEKYYGNSNGKERKMALEYLQDPPPPENTCDIVYVSHNNLGNELNWLPPRYLKEHWWDKSVWGATKRGNLTNVDKYTISCVFDDIESLWESLLEDRKRRRKATVQSLGLDFLSMNEILDDTNSDQKRWCPDGYEVPMSSEISYDRPKVGTSRWKPEKSRYEKCTKPLAEKADRAFESFWNHIYLQQKKEQNSMANVNRTRMHHIIIEDPSNYSPIYASLPLHRITMLRDPWSWVLSKFFWSQGIWLRMSCSNITAPFQKDHTGQGWLEVFSLQYLLQLCGNECSTRYENGFMNLTQIEAQVESNLRNAFSVVGLLHDGMHVFYDMVNKRIDYVDLSLNKDVVGKAHVSTLGIPEQVLRPCRELFLKNKTFQSEVRNTVPAFEALERIFQVGIEVNRFQKEELSKCN